MSAKSPSPPPSPRISTSRLSLYNISQAFIRARRVRRRKAIVFSSGPEPITHPALSNAVNPFKVRVSRCDEFICASGVDVKKLLRPCRRALFEQAQSIGANTLVDEQYITTAILLRSSLIAILQMGNLHRPPKEHQGWPLQSPG